jgi:hypothetical protein
MVIGIFRGRPDDRHYADRCLTELRKHEAENLYCLGNVVGAGTHVVRFLEENGVYVMKGQSEVAYERTHGSGTSRVCNGDVWDDICTLYISISGFPSPYLGARGRLLGEPEVTRQHHELDRKIRDGVPLTREGVLHRNEEFGKRFPDIQLVVMGQEDKTSVWNLREGTLITDGDKMQRPSGRISDPLLINLGTEETPIVCVYTFYRFLGRGNREVGLYPL